MRNFSVTTVYQAKQQDLASIVSRVAHQHTEREVRSLFQYMASAQNVAVAEIKNKYKKMRHIR